MNEKQEYTGGRGSDPEDSLRFSGEWLQKLRRASGNVQYLLNEGYGLKQASTFVGNHFLLSERQRLAIARSVCSNVQFSARKDKELASGDIRGKRLLIDGFNTIITLEVALCDSLILEGMDGAVRDLAGLRGTYRVLPQTEKAARLIFEALDRYGAEEACFYLDKQVSNSGRLLSLIADAHEEGNFRTRLDFVVCDDVDARLKEGGYVVTSDSVILDECRNWFNLNRGILEMAGIETLRIWERSPGGNSEMPG